MSQSEPSRNPRSDPRDGSRQAPRTVYERRLAGRQLELETWSKRELLVSWSRLVAIVAGLVLAWLSIQNQLFSAGWAALPFLVFVVLVVVHERLLRRKAKARSAVEFYRRGIQRLDHEWMETGDQGVRFLDPQHLYAADLDLFGSGSLFQLLDTTRTRRGGETLASWLKNPAEPVEIRARQEAVAELAGKLDLREDLWAIGGELMADRWQTGLDPERLITWASSESRLRPWQCLRFVLPLLAVANLTTALGWWQLGWGPTPLLLLLFLEMGLFLFTRKPMGETIAGIDKASSDLLMLAQLFERLEQEDFVATGLCRRAEALGSTGAGAAVQTARLQRLADLIESRRNAFFAPFAALLLWTSQLAFRLDVWRRESGSLVARWLEVVGELEALSSLGSFAFERPDLPFPEIVEGDVGGPDAAAPRPPVFEGHQIGHPLLPPSDCVRNDVALGPECQAVIVSGSNMSGKSTYLRSCGVNAVLALAGAPVMAGSLRISPLRVGSTIRIQDSLQEGASRFYAEILRLRRLLDSARSATPCFFLLDEILHGTNSHDRRLGAEAVVLALLDRDAIGLVTTHDLALAEIAKEPGSRMKNFHFEDYVEDGKVHFDYRMRPGVVERSNALALMREIGLEV